MNCKVTVATRAHEQLRLGLMQAGSDMLAAGDDETAFPGAHRRLATFCAEELLPHLDRDEEWLRRAEDCPEARLLALSMRAEARALAGAVQELAATSDFCGAMAAARVVHALFAAHVHHAELLSGAVAEPEVAQRR